MEGKPASAEQPINVRQVASFLTPFIRLEREKNYLKF